MRKRSAITAWCAAVLLLAAMIAPAAAQEEILDGQWFKLRAAGRGYSVAMDDSVNKWNFRSTAYMYVEWNDNETQYDYFVVCQVAPGVWVPVTGGSFEDGVDGIFFLPDYYFEFANPDGSFVMNYTTSRIKARVNKFGELKQARFKTLGTEVFFGKDADNATLYGFAKIRGRTIKEKRLPFDIPEQR